MKADIKEYIKKMELQLGYTLMLMKYRFANLCVKSDPVTLISVKVPGHGEEELEIEKVAQVAILDDDNMLVTPFSEEDMNKLRLAIRKEHPEFKQHIETIDIGKMKKDAGVKEADEMMKGDDEKDKKLQMPESPIPSVLEEEEEKELLHVLVLTVPEVDNDRRKLLLDAVKAQVDACKLRMDATIDKAKAQIAPCTAGMSPLEIKEADDKVKEAASMYEENVEKTYEEKKQEIEDAYQRYLKKQTENGTSSAEENSEGSAFSMTFDD